MGFLDKAKKLAEQAMEKAQEALDSVQASTQQQGQQGQTYSAPSAPAPPRAPTPTGPDGRPLGWGTAYVPGMLSRPGWREQRLVDPAAVLPIEQRDRVGVPHSTKSQILEEPYGMGRRWTSGGRSAGLFYQLYPDQQSWQPPSGTAPSSEAPGATTTTLPDGRSLVFMTQSGQHVVLEVTGLDESARRLLAESVSEKLNEGLSLN